MALIPVFAILLVYHREGWALVVFTVAGVSDGIDGFIARRMKQESELGTIIDPIADKLLDDDRVRHADDPGIAKSRAAPCRFRFGLQPP